MKLLVGSPVPAFEIVDAEGVKLTPAVFRGKTLLLSFFRYSSCALCNLQVHQLIQRYPDFHRRGLEIIAVFESPGGTLVKNLAKQSAPFALVADPQAKLYDLFGVENSKENVESTDLGSLQEKIQAAANLGYPLKREDGGNFFRMPADFLISPEGTLVEAFYSERIGTHLPFEAIERFLRRQPQSVVQ